MWKADLGGPLSFSASDVGSHWSILRSYDTIPARLLLKIRLQGKRPGDQLEATVAKAQ